MTASTSPDSFDPGAVRSALGWSQAEMAKHLGCDQSTVCRIEKGAPMSGSIRRLYEMLPSRTKPEAAE